MPRGIYPGNKGKKQSIEFCIKARERMMGKNNPFFGRKHTLETKKKISLAKTGNSPVPEERKIRISKNNSKYWLGKKRLSITGKKHPMWKGGITPINTKIRNSVEYKLWRTKVFTRDNWTCQTCGIRSKSGEPVYLESHHIKSFARYPKLRFDTNNGITLCRECHKLTDTYLWRSNKK